MRPTVATRRAPFACAISRQVTESSNGMAARGHIGSMRIACCRGCERETSARTAARRFLQMMPPSHRCKESSKQDTNVGCVRFSCELNRVQYRVQCGDCGQRSLKFAINLVVLHSKLLGTNTILHSTITLHREHPARCRVHVRPLS